MLAESSIGSSDAPWSSGGAAEAEQTPPRQRKKSKQRAKSKTSGHAKEGGDDCGRRTRVVVVNNNTPLVGPRGSQGRAIAAAQMQIYGSVYYTSTSPTLVDVGSPVPFTASSGSSNGIGPVANGLILPGSGDYQITWSVVGASIDNPSADLIQFQLFQNTSVSPANAVPVPFTDRGTNTTSTTTAPTRSTNLSASAIVRINITHGAFIFLVNTGHVGFTVTPVISSHIITPASLTAMQLMALPS